MSDDQGHQPGRQPAEGVRIIKAEEAQAAIDAGEAAGRRPDDQLRYGDVPPAPTGPRPAHRFPLPDSVNPAEAVALPPLRAGAGRRSEGRGDHPEEPLSAEDLDQPTVASDPSAEPMPALPLDPMPELPLEPAAQAGPEPTVQAVPEPPVLPASEPTVQAVPEPPVQSVPEPRVQAVPEPPVQAVPEPPVLSVPEPRVQAVPEPPVHAVPQPQAQPRSRRRSRYVPEPPVQPAPEPTVSISAPPAGAQPPPPRRATAAHFPPQGPRPTEGEHQVEADAPPWAAADSWQPSGADSTTEMGVPHGGIPEEGITVSGAPPEMPHWSDPPTGEVPRLRFDDERPGAADDMAAWRALGNRGARWRDEDDWDDADGLSDLVGDGEPMGALDQTRTEHSDLYSFDEDFERVRSNRTGSQPVVDLTDYDEAGEEYGVGSDEWATVEATPSRVARRGRGGAGAKRRGRGRPVFLPDGGGSSGAAPAAAAGGAARAATATATEPRRRQHAATATAERRERAAKAERAPQRPPASRPGRGDLGSRVAVGIGLIVLLAICYAVGPQALVGLSALVVVASAAEAYNMTRAPGFRPATLLGLVATIGCVLGAYWRGVGAISVVTVLLFAGAMLWYVLGVVEARPLANVAVTVMVFVWVSVLGSFSAVLLAEPQGKNLFLGAILVAVAADVCAFAVGRWIGSRPIAPRISPHKTIEGFIGGIIGALIVGAVVGKVLHPWSGMRYGLILGLVVGLISPAGDLFESMLKRDLGIKDSGSILGGHGGLLDRFDGILLALPAAYFVTTIAHIH